MKKIILMFAMVLCSVSVACADSVKIDAARASTMLQESSEYIVLDVRTEDEFKEGHIKGAINIDVTQPFDVKAGKLDRAAKYIVYCRTNNRVKKMVRFMDTNEFATVYYIKDGFSGWLEKGLPVEK